MQHTFALEAAEALIEKLALRNRRRSVHAELAGQRAKRKHEDAKLATRELSASGLDAGRLDAMVAERALLRRRLAEQARGRAIEASVAAGSRLRALTPVIEPASSDLFIDQVTFIRSFLGSGIVSDSAIAPGENFAQYRFRNHVPDATDPGRLSFFTLWQNPENSSKVVTAAARLLVNAHLSADCDGGGVGSWFGINEAAKATVKARTTIWAIWNSALFAVGPETILGSVDAVGGFFGDSDSASIEFNEVLPAPSLMVPKKAYVLIEVELLTEWNESLGSVDLDAQSGGFRVLLPGITLTLA